MCTLLNPLPFNGMWYAHDSIELVVRKRSQERMRTEYGYFNMQQNFTETLS